MTPEQRSRQQIDRQLEQAGWIVQDYRQMNISAGQGIAVREFPLTTGHADYMLYVDAKAIGVVEAKPKGHTLSGVETQSGKYLDGLPKTLPNYRLPLPFAYESAGEVPQFTNTLEADVKGDIYEGLLAKSAAESPKVAGQYFTPRELVKAIVDCVQPTAEDTVCDPAAGTGGFLLAAYDYVAKHQGTVRDEHGLKGMMRYNPKFNPQRRQSPTPRPDYVVTQHGMIRSILDAKYRDLWDKQLPREMLYQLVVYAISHRQRAQSSILYPTTSPLAKEARIDISDPLFGKHIGQVCLRPVLLTQLEKLVTSKTSQARRERESLAQRLAFGE